jgi:heme/copper-type cytochrome/quinol oxidase subunit 2
MRLFHRIRGTGRALAILITLLAPAVARACSVCYGASDSPMAEGMNWGIFSLLGIIGFVLAGVAGFFVFLARRSPGPSGPQGSEPWLESEQQPQRL